MKKRKALYKIFYDNDIKDTYWLIEQRIVAEGGNTKQAIGVYVEVVV